MAACKLRNYDRLRPSISNLSTKTIKYGSTFEVEFTVTTRDGVVELNLLSAPFTTHSFGMGQRMLKLEMTEPEAMEDSGKFTTTAAAPASSVVAPASFYILCAVQAGVPSTGVWVQISS
uniref:Galactose oxidase-like Early set domain-containing protein n=1 Tax=Physcomitrium patens TaxID=3218 RepID=A0A2K1KAT2_PHYPA|nr:hypothetical protein PHYPA_010071 [Physcomitrium patens]